MRLYVTVMEATKRALDRLLVKLRLEQKTSILEMTIKNSTSSVVDPARV